MILYLNLIWMVFEREGWVIIAPIIAYKVLNGYENTLNVDTNLDTALKNLHISYLKHFQRSGGNTNKKNKEIRECNKNFVKTWGEVIDVCWCHWKTLHIGKFDFGYLTLCLLKHSYICPNKYFGSKFNFYELWFWLGYQMV